MTKIYLWFINILKKLVSDGENLSNYEKFQISIIIMTNFNCLFMFPNILVLFNLVLKSAIIIFILTQLFHEHSFFLFLLFQKLLIVVILISLFFMFFVTVTFPMIKLAVQTLLPFCLPGRVVNIRSHHFVFLHFS